MTLPQVIWRAGRFTLTFDRPLVMGIVNVTPDSFSDGGRDASAAMAHCDALLAQGAHILDIGGESTRPGAKLLTMDEEIARVLPVVRHALTLGVPVSVDTNRSPVMRVVLDAGADIINDIKALQGEGALFEVAQHGRAGLCLMHMQGEPATMQLAPSYHDVVADVMGFLRQRIDACVAAGIARDRLCVDPGIGFGKSPQHNLTLLKRQRELTALALPLLVGWSRKSTLGVVTGRQASERLPGSLAAALAAVTAGANIVRVHDVAATVDALKVWHAAGIV